jgi:predicted amidohydrolase
MFMSTHKHQRARRLGTVILAGLSAAAACKSGLDYGEGSQLEITRLDAALDELPPDGAGSGDADATGDGGVGDDSAVGSDGAVDGDAGYGDAGGGDGSDAPIFYADAIPSPMPDGAPPDAPVAPAPCVPDKNLKYGEITVERQDPPAQGKWLRVAVVSWNSRDATRGANAQKAAMDKNDNLAWIDRFSGVAKQQCADLLVFPELAVVGYPTKESDKIQPGSANFRSVEEAAGYIEPVPAVGTARVDIDVDKMRASRMLADAAATSGVPIHGGLLEANGKNKPYNTTLIFDKDGKLVARHRKRNIDDPMPLDEKETKYYYENSYLSGGTEATVYPHPKLGNVAVMTCADMYPVQDENGKITEPEPWWRDKYKAGAGFNVMIVSSAWSDPWKPNVEWKWTAMGVVAELSKWANRYIGFSNTVSNAQKDKEGFTAIVAPVGDVKKHATTDKVVVIGYVPAP